jgi:ribosomal protein S18 acetylase RimI-like enzyme
MEVRPYRDADLDDVVALWRRVFPDAPPHNDPIRDVARKLGCQPELFFVACVGGRVVGTTVAGFDGHRGWVHLVAVAPAQRRRGVGSALMRRAEGALVALGCPKLNLQVRATTPEVVGFYERLGFRVEERISMGKLLPEGRAAEGGRA